VLARWRERLPAAGGRAAARGARVLWWCDSVEGAGVAALCLGSAGAGGGRAEGARVLGLAREIARASGGADAGAVGAIAERALAAGGLDGAAARSGEGLLTKVDKGGAAWTELMFSLSIALADERPQARALPGPPRPFPRGCCASRAGAAPGL
jgi:hypothetical protein